MNAIDEELPMKLPKNKVPIRISKRNGLKVALAVVALIVLVIGLQHISLFRKSDTITIGDTNITKNDIANYATQIKSYERLHPLNRFNGGTPIQVATDDLILNAAFKLEAKKLHTSLTDSDLLAPVKFAYTTAQDQQQYIQQLHAGPNFILIRNENIAYELKLTNNLLAKKQLLIAEASFDTPYFNKTSASSVQSLYTQELNRMNNQILPLFQKKESKETMSSSKNFDVVAFGKNSRNTQDYQQYFTKSVVSLSLLSNYVQGQTAFNDLSYNNYIRGKVGKVYGTDAKIATLKNTGDYTGVFASKTGSFMIIRLESKSGGSYNSWTDFLNYYKNKYAEPKVNFHISFSTTVLTSPFNTFVASITSIGQAKAEAYQSDCAAHDVRYTASSYDISTGSQITGTGTSFQEFRNSGNGLCPGEVVGTAYGDSSNGYTISDNCYGSEPTWGVNGFADPSTYKPVPGGPYYSTHNGQQQGNTVGGVPIAIRSAGTIGTSNTPLSDANVYNGWPDWTPGRINDVGHVIIYFLYKDKPPQCSGCGSSGCPACPPPPPTSNTMSITCSNVSGFIWLGNGRGGNKLTGHAYNIIWDNNGGTGPIVGSGTISSAGSPGPNYSTGINGAGIYGNGSSAQTLYIEVFNVTSPPTIQMIGPSPSVQPPGFGATSAGDTGYYNCADSQPTGNVGAACGAVYLSNLNDNNAPGYPVNFSVTISSGGASETINDAANGNATEAFNIYNLGGQPPGANGYHVVLTVYDTPARDSGDSSAGNITTSTDTGPCFGASCSLSVTSNVPTGASGSTADVLANTTFTVTATMYNSGPYLFSNLGGNNLGFTNLQTDGDFHFDGNPNADVPLGQDIPNGGSASTTFTFTAPAFTNGKIFALNVYPDYYGRFALGADCTANIKVYQHFNLTGGASSTPVPTSEDPSSFDYKTWVNSTAPAPVNAASSSSAYKRPATGGQVNMVGPVPYNGPYAANGQTYILNSNAATIPPLQAGDGYYAEIDLGYTDAYVGPSGPDDILDPTGPSQTPAHFTVLNEPYVHFFASDVAAGGGFGNNCTTTPGSINTYLTTTGTQARGSGVQFGAQALSVIEGLSSANLRTTSPTGSTGLTFANSGVDVSGGTPGGNLGGKLGLSNYCVPDYFGEKPATFTNSDTTNNATTVGTAGAQYYKPASGTLTINSGTIPNGTNEAIYVTGNVYITGSGIRYSNAARALVSDVPSLYIVAEGGNIYIDPSVTQLDGVYVSEPTVSNTGAINTCANLSGPISANQVFGNCNNQLVVNGSFVAQQVYLDRTYSSLRYSQSGENPRSGAAPRSCGIPGSDIPVGGPNGLDCAAEIFNFSPELYLSQPVITETSGPTTGKFDFVTSLSPVL